MQTLISTTVNRHQASISMKIKNCIPFVLFILNILLLKLLVAEDKYNEENVNFISNNLNLEGTLLIPEKEKPSSCIIILPGSGPIDRDGYNINNPGLSIPIYKMLAEKLASSGYAVLRYDKRFITYKNTNLIEFSEEDQIEDILSAIHFAKSELKLNKIYIIGHSEGGTLTAVTASRFDGISGIIIISSAAFPIDELLIEQFKHNNNEKIANELKELFEMIKNNYFPDRGVILGVGKAYWSEWIQFTTNIDKIINKIYCPVLIMQGLTDENLPGYTLNKTISIWSNIANNSKNIRFNKYAGVTHLMLNKETSLISDQMINDMVK